MLALKRLTWDRSSPGYVVCCQAPGVLTSHLIVAYQPEICIDVVDSLLSLSKASTDGPCSLLLAFNGERSAHVEQLEGVTGLQIPERGGVVGAICCVCRYISSQELEFTRVSIVDASVAEDRTFVGELLESTSDAVFVGLKSRSTRYKIVHGLYVDEILSDIYGVTGSRDVLPVRFTMSLSWAAFHQLFLRVSEMVYPLLNAVGSFDPNWVKWYYKATDSPEALLLDKWKRGDYAGCSLDVDPPRMASAQFEFALAMCLVPVVQNIGLSHSLVKDGSGRASRLSCRQPDMPQDPTFEQIMGVCGAVEVAAGAPKLGDALPTPGLDRKIYVGLPQSMASLVSGSVVLLTRLDLPRVGARAFLRNARNEMVLVSSSALVQKSYAMSRVTTRLLRPIGIPECVRFAVVESAEGVSQVLEEGDAGRRMWQIEEMRGYVVRNYRRLWDRHVGKDVVGACNVGLVSAAGLLFCMVLQVDRSHQFVCIGDTDKLVGNLGIWENTPWDFDMLYLAIKKFSDGPAPLVVSLGGAQRFLRLLSESSDEDEGLDLRRLMDKFARRDQVIAYAWDSGSGLQL